MVSRKSSWWSRRSSLEKRLTIVGALAGVLAFAFLIALIVVAVNSNSNSNSSGEDALQRICFTPACIKEASTVLQQMNEAADPYVK